MPFTTSGCAWTGYITARIAGKLARLAWWELERTETGRLELTISSDPRLLAGVSAALYHFAEVAGLDEPAKAELVAAFEDAFHEIFGGVSQNSKPIEMSIAAPAGKIETILLFPGDSLHAEKGEKVRKLLTGKLDSVRLETSGDSSRLHLVKNLASPRKKK
jgi:hypothetical protein